MYDWIASVREAGVTAVAAASGANVLRRSIAPCPACGAERRGSDDRRGPVGVRPDDQGWRCHRCGERGDAVAFAAFALAGEPLAKSNFHAVRAACVTWGLCPQVHATVAGAATDATEGIGRFGRTFVDEGREDIGRFGRTSAAARPDRAEVLVLWNASIPVTKACDVAAWIESRGLEPTVIQDRDLARAIPPTGWLPRWAWSSAGSWRVSGHRVLLPLYDERGVLASVRARAVTPDAKPAKSVAPLGTSVSGLVLADGLAQLVLADALLGDEKTPARTFVRETGLVVVEGEVDFLTWTTRSGDAQDSAPAVVGVVAGSWTDALAARIPDGTRVVVRTHHDAPGEEYAARVARSLAGRCTVLRSQEVRS